MTSWPHVLVQTKQCFSCFTSKRTVCLPTEVEFSDLKTCWCCWESDTVDLRKAAIKKKIKKKNTITNYSICDEIKCYNDIASGSPTSLQRLPSTPCDVLRFPESLFTTFREQMRPHWIHLRFMFAKETCSDTAEQQRMWEQCLLPTQLLMWLHCILVLFVWKSISALDFTSCERWTSLQNKRLQSKPCSLVLKTKTWCRIYFSCCVSQ